MPDIAIHYVKIFIHGKSFRWPFTSFVGWGNAFGKSGTTIESESEDET